MNKRRDLESYTRSIISTNIFLTYGSSFSGIGNNLDRCRCFFGPYDRFLMDKSCSVKTIDSSVFKTLNVSVLNCKNERNLRDDDGSD